MNIKEFEFGFLIGIYVQYAINIFSDTIIAFTFFVQDAQLLYSSILHVQIL